MEKSPDNSAHVHAGHFLAALAGQHEQADDGVERPGAMPLARQIAASSSSDSTRSRFAVGVTGRLSERVD